MNTDQEKVYQAIDELYTEFGYSPTVTEISERSQVNRGTTAYLINRLAALGMVTFTPGKARTIRVVKNNGNAGGQDGNDSGAPN